MYVDNVQRYDNDGLSSDNNGQISDNNEVNSENAG
jgi:hypothetical protein